MTGALPPLTIDREQAIPVSVQLHAQLVYHIIAGRLSPGNRLPSVRALAASLGVSVSTLAEVYTRLEADGLVVSDIGRGTFVTPTERWQHHRPFADAAAKATAAVVDLGSHGLGLVEVLGLLLAQRALDEAEKRPVQPVQVLFVECNEPSLEYYGDQVEQALGLSVSRALIRDMPLRDVEIDVAVTNIYHLHELERYFDPAQVPMVGLSVIIDPQTVMRLRELPSGMSVAAVAPTKESARNMRITVSGSVSHLRLVTLATDGSSSGDALSEADVLLVPPRLLPDVHARWNWSGEVIPYLPSSDPLSLNYLRDLVERVQMRKTTTQGA